MAITAPQGLSRDAAGIAAATRVRWTYIAPTLLIYWIISMFDKSNISLVIADPKFFGEMQLVGQTKLLGWLASSMFISYSLAAPIWGWAVTRYGPRNSIMASLDHLGARPVSGPACRKATACCSPRASAWASARPPAIR